MTSLKRDPLNPWGMVVNDHDSDEKDDGADAQDVAESLVIPTNPGLADIMAQQEAERIQQEDQTPTDSEEERMIQLAIEASMRLAEEEAAPTSVPATGTPVPAAASASATSATAAVTDGEGALSEAELAEINRAIEEAEKAERVEEEESLRLALQLQQEEEERARPSIVPPQLANAATNTLRIVSRSVFDALTPKTPAEEQDRILYGAKDFDGADDDYEEDQVDDDDDDEGFRLNSDGGAWVRRRDANTIVGPGGEIRTKHDVGLKGESNATRLLRGAGSATASANKSDWGKGAEATVGKGTGRDTTSTKVGDGAYNAFRKAALQGNKRAVEKGVARHGHGRSENMLGAKTRGGAMDGAVRVHIARAINAGWIAKCNGVVKEGKEALLYHADGGSSEELGGHDVAVKVFKRITEFKGRSAYVDGDNRFHGQKFRDMDKRGQVELWTEKEFRNLIRANRGGVPVPTPLARRDNILFMRFLGEDGWPSPQLREVNLRKGSDKWTTFYCQIMVAIRTLYHCARLVHGDMSEYNVLVCPSELVDNGLGKEKDDSGLEAVLIDFGQAVERSHASATELLHRDLSRIRSFFAKQGILVLEDEEAVKFILEPCRYEPEESTEEPCKSPPDAEDTEDDWVTVETAEAANLEAKDTDGLSKHMDGLAKDTDAVAKDADAMAEEDVMSNDAAVENKSKRLDAGTKPSDTLLPAVVQPFRHVVPGWDSLKDYDHLLEMLSLLDRNAKSP